MWLHELHRRNEDAHSAGTTCAAIGLLARAAEGCTLCAYRYAAAVLPAAHAEWLQEHSEASRAES